MRQRNPILEDRYFEGRRYVRWPKGTTKSRARERYFYNSSQNHTRTLHRDVWERYRGPIPHGYEVHHKDDNVDNNSVRNLELLTKSEHRKLHANSPSHAAAIIKWYYSQPLQTRGCAMCGELFQNRHDKAKYCKRALCVRNRKREEMARLRARWQKA